MATTTARRTRAPPRCSICRQQGHTKRKCPQAVTQTIVTGVTTPIEATDCPICMEPLGKTNCCTTNCGHQFCLQCFVTHTKTKANCPVCRADIPGASPQRPAPYIPTPTRSRTLGSAVEAALMRNGGRFDIFIQNHAEAPLDLWWHMPRPRGYSPISSTLHRNIAPGTVRRVNVGQRGDRFTLVNSLPDWTGTAPPPQLPHFNFQANVPEMHFIFTGTTLIEVE